MKYMYKKSHTNESGFALFLVLVMMIVIAFLTIATMLSTSMDSRTSSNDSDYQLSLQNAQAGLQAAQNEISTWPAATNQHKVFSCDCTGGLCAAKDVVPSDVETTLASVQQGCSSLKDVWRRDNVFTNTTTDPSFKSNSSDPNFRYVIEYLGPAKDAGPGVYIFRITAKGWGKNDMTSALIEEVVQANLY